MEPLVLTIHLILALLLIVVVLLQKSEGAALLSGGGNMQARGKATVMTKLTWVLAAAFIVTSILLTILATRGAGSGSVIDGVTLPAGAESGTSSTGNAELDGLMPPPATAPGSAEPPRADDPAAPPAAETPAEAPAEAPAN